MAQAIFQIKTQQFLDKQTEKTIGMQIRKKDILNLFLEYSQ